jgi:hypothetical protein
MNVHQPEIKIEDKIDNEVLVESQVIVHCSFDSEDDDTLIRIWRTTFLIDRNSGHRSKLVHVDGITLFPNWMPIPANHTARFTLIFSGLPKGCSTFDLVEEIPQSNGFVINNIKRNKMDVYQVTI